MQNDKKVLVYTYGAFDILHPGHVLLLEKAKRLGDSLAVGILSDEAIKKRKGDDRPIQPQADRMKIISSLRCVDTVYRQDSYDPTANLELIHPEIVTKGDDWNILRGYLEPFHFIKFVPLDYSPDYSTSKIVEEIKK